MTLSYEKQSIGLEGVLNARELGGYTMADGRKIQPGRLIRCGYLQTATQEDIRKLSEVYHVKHNCDFRGASEVQHAPDCDIPGADYINLPSIDPTTDDWKGTPLAEVAVKFSHEKMVEVAQSEQAKRQTFNMYPSLVTNEYTQLQYATFLNYVARTERGAVLWHCSQGKDRTGWGSAFVLAALGAPRELIIADFDLSNIFYQELMNELFELLDQRGGTEDDKDVIRGFIGCSTKNFIHSLNIIDQEYGSMHDYLVNQLCLSEEEMERMRANFLV